MFYETIDRIEIREDNIAGFFGWKLLERCYNIKKVGFYGVCKTKGKTKRWGFCSRACKVNQLPDDDEPYEEAEFRYFDKAPAGTDVAGYNSIIGYLDCIFEYKLNLDKLRIHKYKETNFFQMKYRLKINYIINV